MPLVTNRSRVVGIVATTVLFCVIVTGCASNSGANSSEGSGKKSVSRTVKVPENCHDFLVMSAAQREQAYAAVKPVTWYTVAGTERSAGIAEYASACKTADPYFVLSNVDATRGAECGPFAKLDPAVQAEWVAALKNDAPYSLAIAMTPKQMSDACDSLDADSDSLIRASKWFVDYPSTVSWTTETKLGYKATMGLGVGAHQSGPSSKYPVLGNSTGNSNPMMGASCGYNPKTDAIVPVYLHARNTTAGTSPVINGAFAIQSTGQLVSSVEIETLLSSGASCATPDASGTVYSSVQWAEPVKPGEDTGARAVVIIKNFLSPRYPSGATVELSHYVLFSQSSPGGDDPFVSTTSARIHLDGSPAP
jgi:hypothetical protein